MSKVDRVKEEIGVLKLALGALIAVDISLVAWLAQHYATASRVLVLVGVVAIVTVSGLALWVSRIAYRRLEQLEDL